LKNKGLQHKNRKYLLLTPLGLLLLLLIFDRKKAHKLLKDHPKQIPTKFGPSWLIGVGEED